MSAFDRADSRPPNLESVLVRLRPHLLALQRKYGVVEIGIFGSVASHNNETPGDVDILVEFSSEPVSLFEFVPLKQELAEIPGTDVDLLEKHALKPCIAERGRVSVGIDGSPRRHPLPDRFHRDYRQD